MSYQPDPPAGAQPTSPFGVPSAVPLPPAGPPYPHGFAPPAPLAAAPEKRRKGLLFTGIAVAGLGLGAGVVLVALSGSVKEETVKAFARAPVGCTTTLEFEKRATFTIYIETKGTLGTVVGDCTAGGTTYQRVGDDLPGVSITLLNSDDQEAALTATDAPTYSVGDFAGQGYQRVQITEPGTYRLTVTSDDTDFAIAVGGKPDGGADAMSLAGVGAALVGLLLGGLLIVLGLRKKKPGPPTALADGAPVLWQPTQAAPPTPQAAPPTPPAGPGWGAPQQ